MTAHDTPPRDTGNEQASPAGGEGEGPAHAPISPTPASVELGGPKGLEPTRYGDWEKNGRCYDF